MSTLREYVLEKVHGYVRECKLEKLKENVMNQELLQYSWEDLAGALLVKSEDTIYRYSDDYLVGCAGTDKEGKYSIQCILDKVKVLDECLREHRGIALDDLSIDGIPGWFYVHDLILQIEYAVTGFANHNEHCDTEYKFIVADAAARMAIEGISRYVDPIFEFAKKHGYKEECADELLEKFLCELNQIKKEGEI